MSPSIGQHYSEILALTSVVGTAAFLVGARRAGLPIGRVVLLLAGLTMAAHLGGRFHLLAENDRLLEVTRWFSVAQGYRQPGALLGLVTIATLGWRQWNVTASRAASGRARPAP